MALGKAKDGSMFVGAKPFMTYVTGAVMQFSTKNSEEVVLRARGKFISRAVDVAEVVTKRFLEGKVRIDGIRTDSEDFENSDGKVVRVSTIEIALRRIK